jgi:hypothetical protein
MKLTNTLVLIGLLTVPLFAETTITIPPLRISEGATKGVPAGDWKAAEPPAALDFAETKKLAEVAEKEGKVAEALTLWERVLDRTTCKEEERSAARTRIKELRPQVQFNSDPSKARKWNVLALVYTEIDTEIKGKVKEGDDDDTVTRVHKTLTEPELVKIGTELGGFRDLVFEWSSGIVLPEIDVVVVTEPFKKYNGKGYPLRAEDLVTKFKKTSDANNKKYDLVITFVQTHGGEGPNYNAGFAAAIYGARRELNNAAYMMVPWAPYYPFTNRGELDGEMELHEWMHQVDDIIHKNLGYPTGTSRSPDDGRTIDDQRKDGEQEYKRPKDVKTWAYFYKHLMHEHMTRQIWSELTIEQKLPVKPGSVIKIE